MLCHYCGSSITNDSVNLEHKMGISTDDPDKEFQEERIVIGSATCERCGTYTKSVLTYSLVEEPVYGNKHARFEPIGEPIR